MYLPSRSKNFGIGKEIGGSVYVHRAYEDVLPQGLFLPAKKHLGDFEYTVIKFNTRTNAVTFIQVPDFDTVDEPTMGDQLLVRPDGTTKLMRAPADPWIYHHKWLMVGDDYTGFSIERAKERSRKWMALDGIDHSRIGKRSYWRTHVLPRLQE